MVKEYEIKQIVNRNNTIAANGNNATMDWKTSPGQCAEIVSLEVIPDLNGLGVSNLTYCQIEIDDSALPKNKFYVNHYQNMLPMADRLGKRPAKRFGIPMIKDPLLNTTIKIKNDQRFVVRFFTNATGVTQYYYVKATVIFYDSDKAVRDVYGSTYDVAIDYLDRAIAGAEVKKASERSIPVTQNTFSELPGGYDQARPKIFDYNWYAWNLATTVINQHNEVDPTKLSFRVDPKEVFMLQGIGVEPHANLLETWIDIDGTPFPKEYPWYTRPELNVLPFGNPHDEQGAYFLPEAFELMVKGQKFKTTIKDNGTTIPALNQIVALYGKWIYL